MSTALQGDIRGVLAIKPFRRLWQAMALSSLGDWLGLLATTALAQQLAGDNYAKANFAIAGVFIVRLLPAVVLGPLAGVIADRFDRRRMMVLCDILRCALFVSIPVVGNYLWLYVATVLIESVSLFGHQQRKHLYQTWYLDIISKVLIKFLCLLHMAVPLLRQFFFGTCYF